MCAANGRFLRAAQFGDDGGEIVWAEPTARRVRVFFGDTPVADSNNVMILFNGRRVPHLLLPTIRRSLRPLREKLRRRVGPSPWQAHLRVDRRRRAPSGQRGPQLSRPDP